MKRNRLWPATPKSEWVAQWIWVPARLGLGWRNTHAAFRKRVPLAGAVRIHIAAETRYDLFIDGRRVDRGTLVSDVRYKQFDTHELTLPDGEHLLAVHVHGVGESCATSMKAQPRLLVEIEMADGRRVGTDATWRCQALKGYRQEQPVMMSHFGFAEVVDFRQLPADWTSPAFDDAAWPVAEALARPADEAPGVSLLPRDIPPLRTTEVAAARVVCRGRYDAGSFNPREPEITPAVEMSGRRREIRDKRGLSLPLQLGAGESDEFVVLDFGREVTGHLKLGFDGASLGQRVDVGYDETLGANGLPDTRRTYVHFADRFKLREEQASVEGFEARGFRYLLIDVPAGQGGLTLRSAAVDERTYPVEFRGAFHCSDPAYDRIYQACLDNTRLCMLDAYVDCPSRERVTWMDSYVSAQTALVGFGDLKLWRRILYLHAQNVCESGEMAGAVRGFAPCDYDPVVQTYCMFYVCSVADYVWHSGDAETGRNLFPTVMAQFDVFERFENADGLIGERWPGWSFVDWSAMDISGVSGARNALYAVMHRQAAALADWIGMPEQAQALRRRGVRKLRAFRSAFWSADDELFADALHDGARGAVRSQLTNALAIAAGAVKGRAVPRLIDRLIDPEALLPRTPGDYRMKPGFKPQTGGIVPIGTPALAGALLHVLFERNFVDEAMAYIKREWAPITADGALIEHFAMDANTSFCHAWGSWPAVLLSRHVLGVRPTEPGWGKVRVVPHLGPLEWAEGVVATPRGDIRVKVRRDSDYETSVEVEMPEEIGDADELE